MHLFLYSQKALDVYRDVLYIPALILSTINKIKYILPFYSTVFVPNETLNGIWRENKSQSVSSTLARVSLLVKGSLTKDEVCTNNELKSPDK